VPSGLQVWDSAGTLVFDTTSADVGCPVEVVTSTTSSQTKNYTAFAGRTALVLNSRGYGAPPAPSYGSGYPSITFPATAAAGDKAVMLLCSTSGTTISATSPATLNTDLGTTDAASAMRSGAGGSTTVGVSFSAAYGVIAAAYSISEASAAPVLSSPTATATGPTQATIGLTTDTAPTTTTISYQILPAASGAPSAATIVGAPDGTITTGTAGALTKAITGLTTNTAIKVHFAQGLSSNVVSTSSFTPNTLASSGSLSAQTGTAGASFTWTGVTPASLITNAGNGSGFWSIVSSAGFTVAPSINTSTGVLSGGTLSIAGTYAPQVRYTDSSTVPSAQTITHTLSLTVSGGGGGTKTVTLSLTSDGTTPAANLTGLKWAFFDQVNPGSFAAPTAQGTSGSTNSSGVFTVTVTGTTLSVGQVGWLLISDSDGTVSQAPPGKAFSAPVIIS